MILDSGERREFETGAVRDMAEGKGRFDLMPLDAILTISGDEFIAHIAEYMEIGDRWSVQSAARVIIGTEYPTTYHAWLALAKHFEAGAQKYGEYNWQKGIETRSYIDSAVRHYCKHKAGFDDEPHATACLWNLVCCLWTIEHKPELNSYEKDNEKRCTETTCFHNEDLICYKTEGKPAAGKNCPHFTED